MLGMLVLKVILTLIRGGDAVAELDGGCCRVFFSPGDWS